MARNLLDIKDYFVKRSRFVITMLTRVRVLPVLLGLCLMLPGSLAAQKKSSTEKPGGAWIGIFLIPDSVSGYPVLLSVTPGSPAQKGGLTAGDTILSLNGKDVRYKTDKFLAAIKPGERLNLKVRKSKARSVVVTAGVRTATEFVVIDGDSLGPEMAVMIDKMLSQQLDAAIKAFELAIDKNFATKSNGKTTPGSVRFFFEGAELANVTPEQATGNLKGIIVLSIKASSPAQESGLRSGDIIFKVGEAQILSLETFMTRTQKAPDRVMLLEIIRQGKKEKRTLKW